VKAGEHVQASEVKLSADELKAPLATDPAANGELELEQAAQHHGPP
jgi:hypothetical protein